MLRKASESLPSGLEETYDRILNSIPEECSNYAVQILQWLAYSLRPLCIEELAEVVAIDIHGGPGRWFNRDALFAEPQDILGICSSLVTIEENVGWRENRHSIVKLAHSSVKEYLVSERIRSQITARYAIQEAQVHQSIAAASLAYLLQFDEDDLMTQDASQEYPLAMYAVTYWTEHSRWFGDDFSSIQKLYLEFCLDIRKSYAN